MRPNSGAWPAVVLAAVLVTDTTCTQSTAPDIGGLRGAPTQLSIDGRDLTVSVTVWRDFMPIAPPDGRPMIAALRIAAADHGALPPGLGADALWVVNGDQVWESKTLEVTPEGPMIDVVARDGPKWTPGTVVDVYLRVLDANGGQHYLRIPNQHVTRTD